MSGLIVAGRESRKVTFTIEVEASVVGIAGHEKIERVRFEDGRWRSPRLWIERLRALGVAVNLDTLKLGERGAHTPVYEDAQRLSPAMRRKLRGGG